MPARSGRWVELSVEADPEAVEAARAFPFPMYIQAFP